MESLVAYIPMDRRQAMARGIDLPTRTSGAALFADVSGFTPLTETLLQELGPRQGADELTKQLNLVYNALIAEVHRYRGSVVTFGGDAIVCWFDAGSTAFLTSGGIAQAAERATACALNMQQLMDQFSQVQISPNATVSLAIKAAVTAGSARRFRVGNPQIRYLDVLAGATLDRMAAAEKLAKKGEVLLGSEVISYLGDRAKILEWRQVSKNRRAYNYDYQDAASRRFAVLVELVGQVEVSPWPPLKLSSPNQQEEETEETGLTQAQIRPWLLSPVYERLQTGGERFLAELRTAVALFIRFGGLDYDQDDAAGEKLDAYIHWVQNVLARYEGYLIQVTTGDKGSYLYAVFGAPLAYGDDAARAVAAALELRSPPPGKRFISEVQIGISQGRMRAGPYGSATRQTYGVQGSEVNVAARLMEQAELGQVLISKRVAEAAAKNYHFKPIGPVVVKGKQDPIPVYEVASKRLSLSPRSTITVDYKGLRTQLRQILAQNLAGQGQVLRIESGNIVESDHCLAEFTKLATKRGFQVTRAVCPPPGQGIVYHPWQQIFRTWFDLTDEPADTEDHTDWIRQQIAQVETIINDINPDWLALMPLLTDLLNLPIPDNAITATFDRTLRPGVEIALAIELVQAWANNQPSLLLIEEAHRMDASAQNLTVAVARSIASTPILLTIVHRPLNREDMPRLSDLYQLPYYNYLDLDDRAKPKAIHHLGDELQTTSLATTTDPKSEIVGRKPERALLADWLEELVQDGVSRVVVIEGEAGIGKSRLVTDLVDSAQDRGVTSLIGAGTAIEQSTAYHAWRSVFGQLFNLDTGTDANTIIHRTQVLSLLPTEPELLRLVPLLNAVLPLRLQENDVTLQMTGQVRADNTHKLLIRLLQNAARRSPMLLILEDAHWLDSASWALARLVSQRAVPILLVIVTRPVTDPLPEAYTQIIQAPNTQRLQLEALQPEEALEIVCQRLGITKLPESIAALIRTKAEGHPFFSEELAYALRDSGLINIANGECQITSDFEKLSSVNLPDTIEDVITSRIDRLSPQHQLTLKVASVVGRVFSLRLLHAIHPVEADKRHLRDYLDKLERLDITSLASLEPDLAYTFKHAITQEVAYNLMLFTQRWELHQAVAEWLERTYADDLSPHCALLAQHWSRAIQGHPDNPSLVAKTIDYLEQAGEQALRSNANQEAVWFFSEALALDIKQLGGTPQTPGRTDGKIDAGCQPANISAQLRRARWERQLGQAEIRLGNLIQSRKHLQQALTLLNTPVPKQNWQMAVGIIGQTLGQLLDRTGLSRLIRPGLADKENLLEAARAYEQLGETYYWSNETIPAIYSALRTVNLAERAGPSPELARAYANMCLVAGFFSLHFLSRAYSRQAQDTATTINHRPALAWVLEITGIYAIGVGQWDKANDALGRAVEISYQLEDRRRWEECLTALSEVAYLQGQFADSLRRWPDIYTSAQRYGDAQAQSWGLAGQLRCWLALDRIHTDEAATALQTLEAVLAEDVGRSDEINSYGVLALAYSRLGKLQLARQAIDRVANLIAQASPTGFGTIHGYSSAAEVYLGLWETELISDPSASFRTGFRWPVLDFSEPKTKNLKFKARESCQALRRFARVFPIGRPRAWLWQGLYYWLANNPIKAHRAWQKSLATAQRLAMPYEQGLAHYEIGRHLAINNPVRFAHLRNAQEIFRQLRAAYDLTRTEKVLTG